MIFHGGALNHFRGGNDIGVNGETGTWLSGDNGIGEPITVRDNAITAADDYLAVLTGDPFRSSARVST